MQLFHLFPMLLLLLLLSTTASHSQATDSRYSNCAPISYLCGDTNLTIRYPFRVDGRHDYCGHPNFYLNCTGDGTGDDTGGTANVTLAIANEPYQVTSISYMNRLLSLVDTGFVRQSCPQPYRNATLDPALFRVSDRNTNVTLFINCTASATQLPNIYDVLCLFSITGQRSYYRLDNSTMGDVLGRCRSTVVVPMAQEAAMRMASGELGFGAALQEGFSVGWKPGAGWCSGCVSSGGRCGYNSSSSGDHTCFCANGTFLDSCYSSYKINNRGTKRHHHSWRTVVGVIVLVVGFVLVCTLCFFCYRRKLRQRLHSLTILGRNSSSNPPSKELESISFHCQTPLFSYEELEEATKGFDRSEELGDGGYGTVYRGVLRDGRTVAVKRLYETNYKRVEQFMNEVEILSRLRHPNLVTLYGCTSPNSPHLLLVYEYIPNGTLADHLHDPLRSRSLPISLRLSMAVDAAAALSYLHSMDIIHRDVKTHNILVDQNYNVKVADFGLSRLFPTNVTHISTAPQGTPGYLDPEYHRFYQLTDKSDVYSYGVVLMELLSSRPAVDVGRQPNEISLAMMAISKIQKGELDQIVDPSLNCGCDQEEASRAVTQTAELAFRCLQMDREMRPSIKEVVEELREILKALCCRGEVVDAEAKVRDDIRLLKETTSSFFSARSVIDKWLSRSTTLNLSK